MAWLAQHMESHGFEVDLRDHCGHSPLHLAARAGHASAVAILVAHGADVTAKVFLQLDRAERECRYFLPDSQSATQSSCPVFFFFSFLFSQNVIQYSKQQVLTISLALSPFGRNCRFFISLSIIFIQSYTQRPLCGQKKSQNFFRA